jgi:hypothetical protein
MNWQNILNNIEGQGLNVKSRKILEKYVDKICWRQPSLHDTLIEIVECKTITGLIRQKQPSCVTLFDKQQQQQFRQSCYT